MLNLYCLDNYVKLLPMIKDILLLDQIYQIEALILYFYKLFQRTFDYYTLNKILPGEVFCIFYEGVVKLHH